MTYKQLLDKLSTLTAEQLACTVTVSDVTDGEYYPATFTTVTGSDVLDNGHPVIQYPKE